MPFLLHNQQCQSTEGNLTFPHYYGYVFIWYFDTVGWVTGRASGLYKCCTSSPERFLGRVMGDQTYIYTSNVQNKCRGTLQLLSPPFLMTSTTKHMRPNEKGWWKIAWSRSNCPSLGTENIKNISYVVLFSIRDGKCI